MTDYNKLDKRTAEALKIYMATEADTEIALRRMFFLFTGRDIKLIYMKVLDSIMPEDSDMLMGDYIDSITE